MKQTALLLTVSYFLPEVSMNFNFAKISLQQKQQGSGVLFDATGKEQGERAVTALGGLILRAKRFLKILLHTQFLSSFWFLSLS